MRNQSSASRRIEDLGIIQRSVVLEVLGDDRDDRGDLGEDRAERRLRAELERELFDVEPAALGAALERLRDGGVVHISGEDVWASKCARHLNRLGMIAV